MKINDIYESTTSGSVATVAQPMTGGALKRVGQGVYGKQKGGNLLTGTKKKGPYANSLKESEFSGEHLYIVYINGKPATQTTSREEAKEQVAIMREKHPDKEYKIKHGPVGNYQFHVVYVDGKPATKTTSEQEAKNQIAIMRKKHPDKKYEIKKEIKEDELQEDDLILLPGQGRTQRTGFTQHDPDKAEHEGETLKNSLRTIVRVASDLNKRLDNQDHFPEWVSEKVGAIKSMMTSVMQYLASEQEADHELGEAEMADTRTSLGRTGDEITPEHDEAYATLKRIAPRLYRFIRDEAPMPIDPIQTLQYLRRSGGNEGQLLSMFKSQIAADTEKQYGGDHPSLAESMRSFLNNLINESTGGVIAGGGVGESRKPKGEGMWVGVEAYGVKGMNSTPWRKKFKSQEAFEKWLDQTASDVEVLGTREVELHEASDPIAKRVTTGRHGGNDANSWAVFVDGKPAMTGLSKRELPYRKEQVMKIIGEKPGLTGSDMKESKVDELSEIRRLSGVGEGKKTDRMVKHIEKSEEKAGKSKKEAENIAWSTLNKRGYLDNKNHIKGK